MPHRAVFDPVPGSPYPPGAKPHSEEQIKYVSANIRELRIRASYPVTSTSKVCADVTPADPPTTCASGAFIDSVNPIPLGYVGGYFDEVQINKRSPGL